MGMLEREDYAGTRQSDSQCDAANPCMPEILRELAKGSTVFTDGHARILEPRRAGLRA